MTRSPIAPTRAVFFDVDFTLIRPGPTFEGEGYRSFCARHGMQVDPQRLDAAIAEASSVLEQAHSEIYDPELFIRSNRPVRAPKWSLRKSAIVRKSGWLPAASIRKPTSSANRRWILRDEKTPTQYA